jgi:3-hydroxymyristoyl/3-hydroxydecanoyl-(acyl carrier protein) dehydratase
VIELPEIESAERAGAHAVTLRFVVPEGLRYFAGHFPEVPLLPGVVQIGWALELARRHLEVTGEFRALHAVKFTRVIQPGAAVELRLSVAVTDKSLDFAFSSGGHACSEGRVVFH